VPRRSKEGGSEACPRRSEADNARCILREMWTHLLDDWEPQLPVRQSGVRPTGQLCRLPVKVVPSLGAAEIFAFALVSAVLALSMPATATPTFPAEIWSSVLAMSIATVE
jgi:hypothetical protein